MSSNNTKKQTLAERHDPSAISPIATAAIDMGELENYIGYNLRRAHTGEFQRFTSYFDEHDVRPQQFSVLSLIRDNPGINQSQLGNALGIKRANVVTVLHELEARDLVERCASPEDRRSYTLRLTDNGLHTVANLQEVHDTLEAEATAILGEDDKRELLRIVNRLRSKNQNMDRA